MAPAKVVIGVDPHKRLNAVAVLDSKGNVIARQQFPNSAGGFRELKAFWRQWRGRTWAVEGCDGAGRHIAQRLVAAGERVLDVSTRRAALVRVYAGGNGRKTRSASSAGSSSRTRSSIWSPSTSAWWTSTDRSKKPWQPPPPP